MNKTKSSVKDSVGKVALALLKKNDLQSDYIELEKEINKGTNSKRSYEEELWESVAVGLRNEEIQGDFWIIVLFRKQRGVENIMRRQFFHRGSCPTPEFDQTVYKYHRKDDRIEFIWVIPNNVACLNLPLMKKDLPREQMLLVSMIDAFHRGDLDRLAAKHNNEHLVTI